MAKNFIRLRPKNTRNKFIALLSRNNCS